MRFKNLQHALFAVIALGFAAPTFAQAPPPPPPGAQPLSQDTSTPPSADDIFNTMDANNDGIVSRDEFTAWFNAQHPPMGQGGSSTGGGMSGNPMGGNTGGQGMGMGPGSGMGMGPGSGMTHPGSPGMGMAPGSGSGMGMGSGSGMAHPGTPGMGMAPGSGSGMGMGPGSGMTHPGSPGMGMGMGPGSGMNVPPECSEELRTSEQQPQQTNVTASNGQQGNLLYRTVCNMDGYDTVAISLPSDRQALDFNVEAATGHPSSIVFGIRVEGGAAVYHSSAGPAALQSLNITGATAPVYQIYLDRSASAPNARITVRFIDTP